MPKLPTLSLRIATAAFASVLIAGGLSISPALAQVNGPTDLGAAQANDLRVDSRARSPKMPPLGLPVKKLKSSMPLFVKQPTLKNSKLSFTVNVVPWRTSSKNRWSKPDLAGASVKIVRKGQAIKNVSLDPAQEKAKLHPEKKVKFGKVTKAGNMTVSVKIPKAAAKSLRKVGAKKRLKRIRVVFWQYKDVTKKVPGRDVKQFAQSSTKPGTSRPRVRAEANSSFALERGFNTSSWYVNGITNYTPFNLYGSIAPTNCMDLMVNTSGTLGSMQTWMTDMEPMTTSGNVTPQSQSQALATGTVSVVGAAAESSATNALKQGINGGQELNTAGLVGMGVDLAVGFIKDFIKDTGQNNCQNSANSQTWATSFAVQSVASPSSPYYGVNYTGYVNPFLAGWPNAQPSQPLMSSISGSNAQSADSLASNIGAQASVAWNWYNGKINTSGPGSSYFSGGLTAWSGEPLYYYSAAAGGWWSSSVLTVIGFNDTTEQSYGVTPAGNPVATVAQYGTGVTLGCQVPEYNVSVPWNTSAQWSLSNPEPGVTVTGYAGATFFYNGVNSAGTQVYGQAIPSSVTSTIQGGFLPNSPFALVLSGEVLSQINASLGAGGTVTQWGCSVTASVQLPSYGAPSGTTNLGWTSSPGVSGVVAALP